MWTSIASRRLFAITKNCCDSQRLPYSAAQLLSCVLKHSGQSLYDNHSTLTGREASKGLIEASDEITEAKDRELFQNREQVATGS